MNDFPRVEFNRAESAPTKKIKIESDIQAFQKSVAFDRISIGLFKFCQLCSGKQVPPGVLEYRLVNYQDDKAHESEFQNELYTTDKIIDSYVTNRVVIAVLRILEEIKSKIALHPPVENHSRYGNMVFREWFDDLVNDTQNLISKHLSGAVAIGNFDSFKTEAAYYLINSFGSRARIDYGTGHELSFLAFVILSLMCFAGPIDLNGTEVLILFAKYLDLIRTLILTYKLEPAGSHGVWGLDDHFHLPYILGSSQLVDTIQNKQLTTIRPSSILNNSTIKRCSLNNMFFNSISFIKKIKKGPFNEHSPLLYDISNVKTWLKINQGMIKMYFGEVLGKHPVVQHFWFGTLLFPWTDKDGNPLPTSIEDE